MTAIYRCLRGHGPLLQILISKSVSHALGIYAAHKIFSFNKNVLHKVTKNGYGDYKAGGLIYCELPYVILRTFII